MNPLIGKTITSIKLSDDKTEITFVTDTDENITAYAYGDCCSHSWVENIEMPARGLPAKVLEVKDTRLPLDEVEDTQSPVGSSSEGYNVIKFYGFVITTNNGHIDIDYRNSSNGYYGGWLHFPDED